MYFIDPRYIQAAIAAVLLVVLGGVGYWVLNGQSSDSETAQALTSEERTAVQQAATSYVSMVGTFGIKGDRINAENIRARSALAAKTIDQIRTLGIDCDIIDQVRLTDPDPTPTHSPSTTPTTEPVGNPVATQQTRDRQACLDNRKRVVGFIDFRHDIYRTARNELIAPDSPAWIDDHDVEQWKTFEYDAIMMRSYEVSNIRAEAGEQAVSIDGQRRGATVDVTFDTTETVRFPSGGDESWDGSWTVEERRFTGKTLHLVMVEDQGRWKVFDEKGLDYPFLLASWRNPNENDMQGLSEPAVELAPLIPKHPTPLNEVEDVNNEQLQQVLQEIEAYTQQYGYAPYEVHTEPPPASIDELPAPMDHDAREQPDETLNPDE